MSKKDKLLDKLLSKPNDFAWSELVKLLAIFEYREAKIGKTSGSRVKFIRKNYPPITLHKPHPTPHLKRYQIENVINLLKQEALL